MLQMLLYKKLVGKLFEKHGVVRADEFRHVVASRFPFRGNENNEWIKLAKELDAMGYAQMIRTKKGVILIKREQPPQK